MSGLAKVNGSWTGINEAYVKIDGTWVTLGEPLPSIAVTVLDESGNVVEGATISLSDKPYDLSGAYYVDTSVESPFYYAQFNLAGIKVNDVSKVDKVVLSGSYIFGSEGTYSKDASSISNPNGDYIVATSPIGGDGANILSMTFTAYDADGNVLQTAEIPEQA